MSLQPATEPSAEPVVSVIVPCYNSERVIRRCLTALLKQQTAIPFDITVVDSSTDATPQIVEREFPAVRLIHLNERTFAGAARNLGVRATRAPFCLMIDSDCLAKPDLIEQVMARHREDDYAAVGGCLRNGTPLSVSGLIGYWIEFKEFMPSAPRRLEKSIPTANLAYRREVFEKYGGFDDDMYMAEDILFNWKLYLQGERLLFDPALEVTHLNRTGWQKVLGIQIDFGSTSAIARRRGGLPGEVLLKYPFLILLMPWVRSFRALQWFARYDRKTLLAFCFLWPFYLLAAAFWSYGFLREALRD